MLKFVFKNSSYIILEFLYIVSTEASSFRSPHAHCMVSCRETVQPIRRRFSDFNSWELKFSLKLYVRGPRVRLPVLLIHNKCWTNSNFVQLGTSDSVALQQPVLMSFLRGGGPSSIANLNVSELELFLLVFFYVRAFLVKRTKILSSVNKAFM
jgi:hypothetical protein